MHISHQDPRYQYAIMLSNTHKLPEAIAYLKQQITEQPGYFQGWLLLSHYLFDAGCFPEAVQVVQKAEQFDPLGARFKEIQTAMLSGNLSKAEEIARAMLQVEEGHPRAIFTLAQIAEQKRDFAGRVKTLKEGLNFCPANLHFRHMLVGALEANGDYADAIVAAETLVKITETPDSLWTLMNVLLRYGQNTKVLNICPKAEQLCAKDPRQMSEIKLIKGKSQRILGLRSQATESLHQSLKYNPGNGFAWWALADMKNYVFTSQEKAAMGALLERPGLPLALKSVVAFSLAKALESQGEFQQAIKLYHKANQLKHNPNYKPETVTQDLNNAIAAYSVDALSTQGEVSDKHPVPIFIVGLPRSGSTLVEQILASHSQIEGTMEQPVLSSVARQANELCHRQFGTGLMQSVARLNETQLSQLGMAYLDEGALFRSENSHFFTDKLPFNFRHIGLIHKILPQAIIIDVRRNPMDCGLSLYKQFFNHGVEFSYNLANIGKFYNNYLAVTDHWDDVLPGKVMTVQYEELVSQPEKVTRSILEHVGVEFEKTCLSFYNTQRAVHTASSEQVRQPIYNRSIGLWKQVEAELTPLKSSLGDNTLERFSDYL